MCVCVCVCVCSINIYALMDNNCIYTSISCNTHSHIVGKVVSFVEAEPCTIASTGGVAVMKYLSRGHITLVYLRKKQ